MTLDEGIKHSEEVSSRKFDDNVHCIKCAEKHRQFAEWLKDYKRLKEQESAFNKIRNEIKEMTSNRGFLSCSVGHIHQEIDNVFDKYTSESED